MLLRLWRRPALTPREELLCTMGVVLKKKEKKYFGIDLIKVVQDLYAENYETYLREVKDLNKWREVLLCSWVRRLDIFKMAVPTKLKYRFKIIPNKI